MSILSWLQRRRPRRLDEDDFEDEIRAHLAMAEADRVADGLDRQAARDAARRDFGNITLTTEAARGVWTPRWVSALHDQMSDVRYAVRSLARNPVFALTVVGVLTLGIGLNAAVFTMLKGIALTPIAGVEHSSRLSVIVAETSAGRQTRLSFPDYRYLRDHDSGFVDLFGSIVADVSLGRGRGARVVFGEIVTGNYFRALGVRAQIGRTLMPADEVAPGRHPVVVISDGLWRRDYGADAGIVGRTLEINNRQLTVVGVTEPSFHGTIVSYDVELFLPVMNAPELGYTFGSQQTTPSEILGDRRAGVFYAHGFLRPGTSQATATAQADAVWATLVRERPMSDIAQRLKVLPYLQTPSSGPTFILPTLGVLSAMGLLVLLVACANIAGLVLVRGVSRRGEIAIRLALGASRARIVRLLVVESLVLAVPGALLGVLLAQWGTPVFLGYARALAAPQLLFFNMGVDRLVLGFAVVVGCGCALACGFVPALRSTRVDLVTVINEDGSPRGAARGRMRGGLVIAQVAVSLLLLIGAGLTARTVDAARLAHPGFDTDRVSAVRVDVKQNGYDSPRGRVFSRRLLDAARLGAGIESATLAIHIPLGLIDTRAQPVTIEGYEPRRGEDQAFMSNAVGPDYFRTLRVGVLAGREFLDHDNESSEPVAVVNATMAQRFWGGPSQAIGRRIRFGDAAWRTVVGVAADLKYSRVNETPRPYVYVPFFQAYRSSMVLHTRGAAPVDDLVQQARTMVEGLDPDLPIFSARPMIDETRGALLFYELTATMLFVFGAAGMVLAAMGTYGLVAYTVKQRTHEIGIRIALGASRSSVVRGFLDRGLRLGLTGAAIGLATAVAGSRLIGRVLFGVSPIDPTSYLQAILTVLGAVAVATLFPACRAARTNPLSALRHQ